MTAGPCSSAPGFKSARSYTRVGRNPSSKYTSLLPRDAADESDGPKGWDLKGGLVVMTIPSTPNISTTIGWSFREYLNSLSCSWLNRSIARAKLSAENPSSFSRGTWTAYGSNPPAYKVGQKVAVRYPPGRPDLAAIADFQHRYLFEFASIGIGAAGVGTAFLLLYLNWLY